MFSIEFFKKGCINKVSTKKVIVNLLQWLYEKDYEYSISICERTEHYNNGKSVDTYIENARIIDFVEYKNEECEDFAEDFCELMLNSPKEIRTIKIDWDNMLSCDFSCTSINDVYEFIGSFTEKDLSYRIKFTWNIEQMLEK